MSQTPDSDSGGYLIPPLWLEENNLTQDDLDEFRAKFLAAIERGGSPVILPPDPPRLIRWWEWPAVQWWWYRQYKRADRRAFRRECAVIRWRSAWRPDGD
jgi:hypothetical protein